MSWFWNINKCIHWTFGKLWQHNLYANLTAQSYFVFLLSKRIFPRIIKNIFIHWSKAKARPCYLISVLCRSRRVCRPRYSVTGDPLCLSCTCVQRCLWVNIPCWPRGSRPIYRPRILCTEVSDHQIKRCRPNQVRPIHYMGLYLVPGHSLGLALLFSQGWWSYWSSNVMWT